MITLAWYLLKVIICSSVLCGYYFLALRNKAFHRWNRFYLLSAIAISLLAPVIKINIFQNNNDKGTAVQWLQTISYGDEAVIEYSKNSSFQLNTENLAENLYLSISMIFLFIFLASLFKIKRLRQKYPQTKIDDIRFVNTHAQGTPFSFFKSIFWNDAIDLHSKSGQQIFNHEVAHIKEKHSYDKIFMNLVLIVFWIDPFFWLIRKELYMIHEFIADKEAMEDNDINAFAEMILQTVYPGQNFSITNKFFYSPLKRRIMMLTKNKNPKVNYLSRLLVLPLAAIVFFAFTLKIHSADPINFYDGKTINVVIDAGHGGVDKGATADGWNEKDITLSLAKKIAALNKNNRINVLLTRDNDQTISVQDRVLFAKEKKADLFISLHLNLSTNEQINGFSVLIDKNNSVQNQLLASALISELKDAYKTADQIGTRSNNGILVLDKNICPSVIVELGNLNNASDLRFVSNSTDQDKIAKNILNAINNYATSENAVKPASFLNSPASSLQAKDTVPDISSTSKAKALYVLNGKIITSKEAQNINRQNIQSISVLKEDRAISAYGEKGKNGVIEITTKDKNANVLAHNLNKKNTLNILNNSLILLDGKEITDDQMKNIPPNTIKSISVLKGKIGELKYGQKGKNGVVEIHTKPSDVRLITGNQKDTIPDKVFTKVETEASFPGGQQAWIKYITGKIQASIDTFTKADYGTCVVRFIVNTDGTVSDVQATTMKGTQLAAISINAIKDGPKWIPASQNGHTVAAYRLQPVTLTNPDEIKKGPNGIP